eukprot:350661-Chlamydomonas_euryale.AAC.1
MQRVRQGPTLIAASAAAAAAAAAVAAAAASARRQHCCCGTRVALPKVFPLVPTMIFACVTNRSGAGSSPPSPQAPHNAAHQDAAAIQLVCLPLLCSNDEDRQIQLQQHRRQQGRHIGVHQENAERLAGLRAQVHGLGCELHRRQQGPPPARARCIAPEHSHCSRPRSSAGLGHTHRVGHTHTGLVTHTGRSHTHRAGSHTQAKAFRISIWPRRTCARKHICCGALGTPALRHAGAWGAGMPLPH